MEIRLNDSSFRFVILVFNSLSTYNCAILIFLRYQENGNIQAIKGLGTELFGRENVTNGVRPNCYTIRGD